MGIFWPLQRVKCPNESGGPAIRTSLQDRRAVASRGGVTFASLRLAICIIRTLRSVSSWEAFGSVQDHSRLPSRHCSFHGPLGGNAGAARHLFHWPRAGHCQVVRQESYAAGRPSPAGSGSRSGGRSWRGRPAGDRGEVGRRQIVARSAGGQSQSLTFRSRPAGR